ncbi:MAG: transcription termination/antitermination protein NusG [Gemmataceae bacterium]
MSDESTFTPQDDSNADEQTPFATDGADTASIGDVPDVPVEGEAETDGEALVESEDESGSLQEAHLGVNDHDENLEDAPDPNLDPLEELETEEALSPEQLEDEVEDEEDAADQVAEEAEMDAEVGQKEDLQEAASDVAADQGFSLPEEAMEESSEETDDPFGIPKLEDEAENELSEEEFSDESIEGSNFDSSEVAAIGVEEPSGDSQEEIEEAPEPPANENWKWYIVKVQSGREETIKNAIERRVKIDGLEDYFDQIVIPTEKETVIQKGKRVVRERKKFPGYIAAHVEYNEQILYLFRETSGVGDFVGGAPDKAPIPMTAKEVVDMVGTDKPDDPAAGAPADVVSPFHVGDHVKVKDGMFKDLDGEVKEIMKDKAQVRVEVVVLGRPVNVELEYWQVEEWTASERED